MGNLIIIIIIVMKKISKKNKLTNEVPSERMAKLCKF